MAMAVALKTLGALGLRHPDAGRIRAHPAIGTGPRRRVHRGQVAGYRHGQSLRLEILVSTRRIGSASNAIPQKRIKPMSRTGTGVGSDLLPGKRPERRRSRGPAARIRSFHPITATIPARTPAPAALSITDNHAPTCGWGEGSSNSPTRSSSSPILLHLGTGYSGSFGPRLGHP